jgi:hypothetical protein
MRSVWGAASAETWNMSTCLLPALVCGKSGHCEPWLKLYCDADMVLDTQDVAEYARSHARGLRLTFWLFKTDQVPAA